MVESIVLPKIITTINVTELKATENVLRRVCNNESICVENLGVVKETLENVAIIYNLGSMPTNHDITTLLNENGYQWDEEFNTLTPLKK